MAVHYFNAKTESLLLANDSTITSVRLYKKIPKISWEETFQRFHSAITNNTTMNYLAIDLREIVQLSHGTEVLFQAVEQCNSIETFAIWNSFSLNESRTFARALVSAISNNKNIKYCIFGSVRLQSQDLATLLRNSSSATRLVFDESELDFESNEGNNSFDLLANVRDLRDAFEQNTTLNQLSFILRPDYAQNNQKILEAARRNKSISKFLVQFHQGSNERYNPNALEEIAMYLNVSGINYVCLYGMKWDNTTFGAFASHLRRKEKPIKVLQFYYCQFDKDSSILLKEFVSGCKDFQHIYFDGNTTFSDINILGEIIGRGNGPKVLSLAGYSGLSSPINGLESICTSLESKTSQLRTLLLPNLSSSQLDYLLDKVPTFKNIRQLNFRLDAESVHLKEKLISAFCRNGCLFYTIIKATWMSARDFYLLECFCRRNKMLWEGQKIPVSAIPIYFYSSAIATSGIGPKDIVAALNKLGDNICKSKYEKLFIF